MKTTFAALAVAAMFAHPAAATTFPSLTTIYVGAGVHDSGTADNTGTATAFHCSNVSGGSVQIRFGYFRPTVASREASREMFRMGKLRSP